MGGIIYAGEIGTIIDIDMRTNITGATNVTLIVYKPDRTTDVWLPVIIGSRILRYKTMRGDLVVGMTQIQPRLTLGSWTGNGDPVLLEVHEPLSG
jgi:hypothetical protein